MWLLQFVDFESNSLGDGLNLEGLDGRMTDGLGDPIGQVLINGSEHAHWKQIPAQSLVDREGHSDGNSRCLSRIALFFTALMCPETLLT